MNPAAPVTTARAGPPRCPAMPAVMLRTLDPGIPRIRGNSGDVSPLAPRISAAFAVGPIYRCLIGRRAAPALIRMGAHDVSIYAPMAHGIYERGIGFAGGAERQTELLARAL